MNSRCEVSAKIGKARPHRAIELFRIHSPKAINYLVALAGVAGLASAGLASAGFIVDVAGAVVAGVAGVAGVVVAGVAGAVVVGVAGFTLVLPLFALLATSLPQAIPRALRPKTADNTNTFVILVRLLSFSKIIQSCFQGSVDETQPFCRELFLFLGKRENRNTRGVCQPKIDKKITFF